MLTTKHAPHGFPSTDSDLADPLPPVGALVESARGAHVVLAWSASEGGPVAYLPAAGFTSWRGLLAAVHTASRDAGGAEDRCRGSVTFAEVHRRLEGTWRVHRRSHYARRFTVTTPCLDGSPMGAAIGPLAATPWSTLLVACESGVVEINPWCRGSAPVRRSLGGAGRGRVAALSIRELRDGRAEVAVAEQAGGLVVVRTLAPWTRAFSWGRTPLADDGVGVVERRTQADIDLVGPRTELRLRPGSEIVGSAMTPDGRSRFVSVRSDGAGPVPVRGLVVGLRVRRGG